MTNYKSKKYFAITISPPPYNGNEYFKEYEDRKSFKRYLKQCSKHYLFISEWDNNDRLHYHGIIRIDDKYKWYHSSKRKFKIIGFTKIKLIKNFTEHLRWLCYMKKDCWINESTSDSESDSRSRSDKVLRCSEGEKRSRSTFWGAMKPKWRLNVPSGHKVSNIKTI